MTKASFNACPSFYKSKVGYTQLRWRLLQCVSRRSFSFTDASHMLTFRAERWGAAANPEEDYGKMWRHYKISTSGRLKEVVVVVEGEDWDMFVCLYVLCIKLVHTGIVSFLNLKGKIHHFLHRCHSFQMASKSNKKNFMSLKFKVLLSEIQKGKSVILAASAF